MNVRNSAAELKKYKSFKSEEKKKAPQLVAAAELGFLHKGFPARLQSLKEICPLGISYHKRVASVQHSLLIILRLSTRTP